MVVQVTILGQRCNLGGLAKDKVNIGRERKSVVVRNTLCVSVGPSFLRHNV